jgi:hypothetical protein
LRAKAHTSTSPHNANAASPAATIAQSCSPRRGGVAVAAPAPGGVTFHQARKLIRGLVRKGRVVGMDVVEITPSIDVNRISSITAGRLFVNLMGAAVRANYFDTATPRVERESGQRQADTTDVGM